MLICTLKICMHVNSFRKLTHKETYLKRVKHINPLNPDSIITIIYRDVNAKVNGFEKMSLISWETIALCFLCVFHFVFHTSESHVNEHHSSTVYTSIVDMKNNVEQQRLISAVYMCCHTYIRILHYLLFTRWWRLLGDSCTVQVHCP